MKNKKNIKLNKERFFQILNEEFRTVVREDDIETTISGSNSNDPSTLSSNLKIRAEKLSPQDKQSMDAAITKARKIGKCNLDYNFYHKNPSAFLYLTDALATIYIKNPEESEKVKNALMEIFSPYSKFQDPNSNKTTMSDFFNRIGRFVSGKVSNAGTNSTYVIDHESDDIRLEGFYNGFDKALKHFNPDAPKSDFNSLLSQAIATSQIDAWRKTKGMHTVDGQTRLRNKVSLDSPLGGSDDEESGSLKDTIAQSPEDTIDNKHDQVYNARLSHAFIKAMNKVLSSSPEVLEFFKMYTVDNLENEEIAEKLGVKASYLRLKKLRWEEALTKAIPKIEDIMSNEMGEGVELPLPDDRFRFPRLKKDNEKKRINKNYILPEMFLESYILRDKNSNEYLDFNMFAEFSKDDFIDYTKTIVNESNESIKRISLIYNDLNKTLYYLAEGYDGNYNIDTADLFEDVKAYVDESINIIGVLQNEIMKLDDIAFKIHKSFDYPQVAEELKKVIEPITKELEAWPNKLSFMLDSVRRKYKSNNAFGI